jgi:hypothetical protein
MTQDRKSLGWEGGLAPAQMGLTQPERGQAHLPNLELLKLNLNLFAILIL